MDLQVCVYISGTWGMQTVLGLCACCLCGAYPPRQHRERGNEMQTGCAEPEQFLLPTHRGNWLSCELQTKAKERTNQQITMSDWCSGGSELTPGSNIQYPSLCMCVAAPLEWSQKMGCGHRLDGATAMLLIQQISVSLLKETNDCATRVSVGAACKNKMHLGISEGPQWWEKNKLNKIFDLIFPLQIPFAVGFDDFNGIKSWLWDA